MLFYGYPCEHLATKVLIIIITKLRAVLLLSEMYSTPAAEEANYEILYSRDGTHPTYKKRTESKLLSGRVHYPCQLPHTPPPPTPHMLRFVSPCGSFLRMAVQKVPFYLHCRFLFTPASSSPASSYLSLLVAAHAIYVCFLYTPRLTLSRKNACCLIFCRVSGRSSGPPSARYWKFLEC